MRYLIGIEILVLWMNSEFRIILLYAAPWIRRRCLRCRRGCWWASWCRRRRSRPWTRAAQIPQSRTGPASNVGHWWFWEHIFLENCRPFPVSQKLFLQRGIFMPLTLDTHHKNVQFGTWNVDKIDLIIGFVYMQGTNLACSVLRKLIWSHYWPCQYVQLCSKPICLAEVTNHNVSSDCNIFGCRTPKSEVLRRVKNASWQEFPDNKHWARILDHHKRS